MANPAKCHLGQQEEIYLGYTVGCGKVQVLKDWPAPTIKRQVRQFLGEVEYYCQFIPDFTTLAASLSDLTKNLLAQKVQ